MIKPAKHDDFGIGFDADDDFTPGAAQGWDVETSDDPYVRDP